VLAFFIFAGFSKSWLIKKASGAKKPALAFLFNLHICIQYLLDIPR
jgi:hypothetical protein